MADQAHSLPGLTTLAEINLALQCLVQGFQGGGFEFFAGFAERLSRDDLGFQRGGATGVIHLACHQSSQATATNLQYASLF